MNARLPIISSVLLLAACASNAPRESETPLVPPEAELAAQPASEGSIYAAGGGLALFEDNKAHRVGDMLTVLLVEKTQAEKKANTSTNKSTEASIEPPTLFGRPVTSSGVPILDTSIGTDQNFTGGGAATQSNALTGSITVIVSRVLPNGNLVVRGEKNVRINQGTEQITLEGLVRPIDIATNNTVTSDRIANARIAYGGRGSVADANAMGWVARFFNSPLFPF